ncbi:fimbria/pilus outer membrane usher protein [Citrobacter amalonaticus]|uniref:fimbria/pilus outer membrane usher protein n=1 Tax=Citrobacter amalonaticus TaxID=35703 RepID=UPI00339C9C16
MKAILTKGKLQVCNKYLACCLFMMLSIKSSYSSESKYSFDQSVLDEGGNNVSLNFINNNKAPAGSYVVDVFLNNEYKETLPIFFAENNNGNEITPQLSCQQFSKYGIKKEFLNGCIDGGAFFKKYDDWKVDFDFYKQRLYINIPSYFLDVPEDGVYPSSQWDDGINAFYINYDVNAFHGDYSFNQNRESQNNAYSFFESGINIGAWRIRNQSTLMYDKINGAAWNNINNYLERGIYNSRSRIVIGGGFTSSDVIDSVPFYGIMLGTDKEMYPDRYYHSSPVIKGVAKTSAQVTVESNGLTIYSTSVKPGDFEINDLPYVGLSSMLKVTINESDGTRNTFYVPYNSPPISAKNGFLDYNIMVGRYRTNGNRTIGPNLAQATMFYGLPYNLTTYGALQASGIFKSTKIGLSTDLGNFGSMSFDINHSKKNIKWENESGDAINFKYYKNISNTNTGINISYFRELSKGYSSLNDAFSQIEQFWYDKYDSKNIFSLAFNQSLSDFGTLQLSLNHEDDWSGKYKSNYLNFSYGFNVLGSNISLNLSKQRTSNGSNEDYAYLNIMVPLDKFTSKNIYTHYSMANSSDGGLSQSVGLSGRSFNQNLSWNITNTSLPNNSANRTNADLYWMGRKGNLYGGYMYDKFTRQYNIGMNGAVLFSQYGLTLGQKLGPANALIITPDAGDISITNMRGVKTDRDGYAILGGGLLPYRKSIISLDTLTLPNNIEIARSDNKIIPTKGAIVASKFETIVGYKRIVTLRKRNGDYIPMGSIVTSNNGANVGIVGEDGETYISGLRDKGELTVIWGRGNDKKCKVSYSLIKGNDKTPTTMSCL